MIIKQFSIYSFGSAAIRAPEYSECLIPNEYFGKIFFVTYTLKFCEKWINRPVKVNWGHWLVLVDMHQVQASSLNRKAVHF